MGSKRPAYDLLPEFSLRAEDFAFDDTRKRTEGGTATWHFAVTGPGGETVPLEYRRPVRSLRSAEEMLAVMALFGVDVGAGCCLHAAAHALKGREARLRAAGLDRVADALDAQRAFWLPTESQHRWREFLYGLHLPWECITVDGEKVMPQTCGSDRPLSASGTDLSSEGRGAEEARQREGRPLPAYRLLVKDFRVGWRWFGEPCTCVEWTLAVTQCGEKQWASKYAWQETVEFAWDPRNLREADELLAQFALFGVELRGRSDLKRAGRAVVGRAASVRVPAPWKIGDVFRSQGAFWTPTEAQRRARERFYGFFLIDEAVDIDDSLAAMPPRPGMAPADAVREVKARRAAEAAEA